MNPQQKPHELKSLFGEETCRLIDRKQRPRDGNEYEVRLPVSVHAGIQMSALGSVPTPL